MNVYFIGKESVSNGEVTIEGDLYHHLTNVLRIKNGESIHLSDNETTEYEGIISEISKKYIKVTIEDTYEIRGEAPIFVSLIQCLPRGDKMEQIVQKSTELGVAQILGVESDHSQIRLKDKSKDKEKRYYKIAAAAAEQCGRGRVPKVSMAKSLAQALDALQKDCKIIFCYEKEGNHSLKSELIKVATKNIAVLIGPEGGFSNDEAEMILSRGGVPVTIGPRILRTETAGPAVIAAMMYELGDWGCFVENS